MQRTGIAALAVASTALVLAGCGAGGAQQGSDEPATKKTKATIDYAIWNEAQKPALKEVIAAFNEEYPDITVKVQVTPFEQYFTKMQTLGASKTLPDVFTMNELNVQKYIDAELIAPVTPLVDAGDLDPADYPEPLVDGYSKDDTLYGAPQNSQSIAMWYNKDLFQQAGVQPPTEDWDWDDLRTAAKSISDALGDQGVFGIATDLTGQLAYYNTVFQAGGEIISEDKKSSGYGEKKTIEGLQLWADLVADGSSPSVQQLSDTPGNEMFANGKAAMTFNGAWSATEVAESPVAGVADVAPLPKGEQEASVVTGTAAVASAHSENLPAARAFQAFLGSERAQEIIAAAKLGNPAVVDSQQVFVDSAPEYNLQAFADAHDHAVAFPTSVDTAAWNLLETKMLPAAFSGEEPVEKVAGELADQMDELLAKEDG